MCSNYVSPGDNNLKDIVVDIIVARDELAAAKKAPLAPCTCTGFQAQYEGCDCVRDQHVRDAERKLWEVLNKL